MKKLRWSILFEDEDIIVVEKPAPFLTIPDRYDKNIPNVYGALSFKREKVFINHRIDKDTSGLLVFSKNEEAHKNLSSQFENREVKKLYYAIVQGEPTEEVGIINLAIAHNSARRKGMVIDVKGKEAITKYRIIEAWQHYSLIEISLLTGRQHQIRVHMKNIYCPLLCDSLYGDGEPFFLSKIKRKMNKSKSKTEKALITRCALHAHQLNFKHPKTKKELEFKSDLPKDMKAVVNQLGKWGTKKSL